MSKRTSWSAGWRVVLVALAAVLLMQAVSTACPLCKESIPLDDAAAGVAADATRTARGFAWSILAMIAIPFTMMGGAVLVLTSAYRRTLQLQQAAAGSGDAAGPNRNRHDPSV